MAKLKEITKDWSIQRIIDKYPDSVAILVEYGFHCIGCAMAQYETLEQGARAHELSSAKLENLIAELNMLVKKKDALVKKS